jgi:hypothetical protein
MGRKMKLMHSKKLNNLGLCIMQENISFKIPIEIGKTSLRGYLLNTYVDDDLSGLYYDSTISSEWNSEDMIIRLCIIADLNNQEVGFADDPIEFQLIGTFNNQTFKICEYMENDRIYIYGSDELNVHIFVQELISILKKQHAYVLSIILMQQILLMENQMKN